MTTALVDGDILAYRTAAALEVATDWGDGQWTLHSDGNAACASLEKQLEALQEELEAGRLIIALSDKRNWRHGVYSEYKMNRSGVRRPVCLPVLREYLLKQHKALIKPSLEADDVLGIIATSGIVKAPVVCSVDKDLKTIPGNHYHLDTKEHSSVTAEEADRRFYIQALSGDPTDGYPGCPGIGPKRAEALVDSAGPNPWPAIVAAYAKAGMGEEFALSMARCARICRVEDYDFKKRKVLLWTPKTS